MKTFSIIIPSYNSKSFIKATIDALINTDYDKNLIEIIIIDDGSTDGSFEYVNQLIKDLPYIKQIKKHNGNWGSVINYAKNQHLVKNEMVAVLDSDDQYLPDTFKIVAQKIQNHDLFAGGFYHFDGQKKQKKINTYWFLTKRILTNKKQMNGPYCLPLPLFFTKQLFYQLNDLREGVAFQDPDFFSQLTKNAKSMIFTKKAVGLYYYKRPNNSRSITWDYDKRFEPELYACYQLIKNDASECVSYRLNVKPFYQLVKKENIIFEIKNRLSFKWFPWYLRFFYFLIYFFKHKKLFKKVK